MQNITASVSTLRQLDTNIELKQPRQHMYSVGVNDTPVFLLNEYIDELNPANFNILNKILNWISLKFFKMNNFLNWIFLNWIIFWIEFCPKFSYWIFYWIEFCPKISYRIFLLNWIGLNNWKSVVFWIDIVILYPKIP